MELVEVAKRTAAVLLATIFIVGVLAVPPVWADRYGEGEGWFIRANYQPKKDRTRCEEIRYPSGLPGDRTKHRHVTKVWHKPGHVTARECIGLKPLPKKKK
jgi:hypothetical protein